MTIDIHADDYGYSLNTSKDILECIKEEKLDSISIITNTHCFNESMNMLYDAIPTFSYLPCMSIHINLVEGIFNNRFLPTSWVKLFLSSYSPKRKKIKRTIKDEISSQLLNGSEAIYKCLDIAKKNNITCKQKGIRIDSHMHTHSIPIVWECLKEVLEENKIIVEYIRNPKEPIIPFTSKTDLLFSYKPTNLVKNIILNLFSKKIDKYCEEMAIEKEYMWGLIMSGSMDFNRVNKLFPSMHRYANDNERNLEILFHPGYALDNEYSKELNDNNFKSFNNSINRHIEKDTVKRINEIVK